MHFIKVCALSFLTGILFLLGACGAEEVIVAETQETISEPAIVEQQTVTGSFRSVEGVMDKLSCYCSYGGYITTEDGSSITVCFNESVESCDKITVTGYQTAKNIDSNGACNGGIMGFLKVQSYIVGETDF